METKKSFDNLSKTSSLSKDSLTAMKKKLQKQREKNKQILLLAGIYFNQKNN